VFNLNQKNLVPMLVGGISLVLILGALGYFFLTAKSNKSGEISTKRTDQTTNSGSSSSNKKSSIEGYTGTLLAGDSSPLLAFEKTDYDQALKADKLVILYFYANWCPICRAEFPKMEEVFDELTGDDVIGFRINYNDDETEESEKDLAREFGVAYQHTKVFLKNGERVLKSPESWEKDRYTSEINKALEK